MFSLAATPPALRAVGSAPEAEVAGRNATAPQTLFRPDQVATWFASEAHALPPGMPLRPSGLDAQPGWKPGTLANQQPAPITSQPAGASQSMRLASGATPNWSIVSSPNANSTQDHTVLNGVTCVSASDCWAVGYYSSSADQTLVEHWDGMSWAIISSPNISASTNNYLVGVTCVSASDCWAVGYYLGGNGVQGVDQKRVVEREGGTAWVVSSSPNTSATDGNYL